MYVCMYACMYVLYVCIYIYMYVYIYIYGLYIVSPSIKGRLWEFKGGTIKGPQLLNPVEFP